MSTEEETICAGCDRPLTACVCLIDFQDDDVADFEDEMCPHGCLPDEECEDCDDDE